MKIAKPGWRLEDWPDHPEHAFTLHGREYLEIRPGIELRAHIADGAVGLYSSPTLLTHRHPLKWDGQFRGVFAWSTVHHDCPPWGHIGNFGRGELE